MVLVRVLVPVLVLVLVVRVLVPVALRERLVIARRMAPHG